MRVFIYFLIITSLFSNQKDEGEIRAKNLIQNIQKQKSMTKNITRQKLPKEFSYLEKIVKDVNEKRPILTITYMTSSTIPIITHHAFSSTITKLSEQFNVEGRMCMIGVESDDFKPYILKLMNQLSDIPNYHVQMDFCPDLFEKLHIDRVPAYAVSVCQKPEMHPEDCKVKYYLKGDVTLKYLFEKLSEINPYFEEYYNAL